MTLNIRTALADSMSTMHLGAAIAEVLRGGDVVLLTGELGAGKTTLTKGLVAALGGTEEVTSPTFTLMHLYESNPPVAHVDCWRLEDLSDVVDLALEEGLDEGGIAVIEWGELAASLLGRDALIVSIEFEEAADDVHAEDEVPSPTRRALLGGTGATWPARMRHLQEACRTLGLKSELVEAPLHDEPAASR